MTEPSVTVRRSFGYDLYSLIGPEMSENAVLLYALAEKALPWSMATLACKIACEKAAKVAISLRTFSETTDVKITRCVRSSDPCGDVRLHDIIGCLVHHKAIEITLDPPLQARPKSEQWIEIEGQSQHRLSDIIVKSDKFRYQAALSDFANSVVNEIDAQINSPSGRELRKAR